METDHNQILHFEYMMQMEYSEQVNQSFFTIKGLPCSDARQQVKEVKILMIPDVEWSEGKDSFGNGYIYGSIRTPHKASVYQVSGTVEIGQILYEEVVDEQLLPMFRHPFGMNRPGPELRAYFDGLKDNLEDNDYVNAIFLMRSLHQHFSYQKGVTDVNTTAEEALKTGCGVCQDYVHIFIALCHMAGIPARYVTGIITGEGESHAWAEVMYHGKWIGMDPTNDVLVARSHIKFSHGRDASDCLINRGILRGGGNQNQLVKVMVTEE